MKSTKKIGNKIMKNPPINHPTSKDKIKVSIKINITTF